MELDTTITVDIQEFSDFIYSDKFAHFLVNEAPSFPTAAFILQKLLDISDELKGENN